MLVYGRNSFPIQWLLGVSSTTFNNNVKLSVVSQPSTIKGEST